MARRERGSRQGALVRVVAIPLVGLVLAGCGSGDEAAGGDVLPPATLPADQDPGLVHVHGLGVDPADGHVYAATHFGLWRVRADGGAERVGRASHDLMGFTVVGADHFIASGHPVLTGDLPPLLGLIESTDDGRTWRSVSLLGQADFHALRVAHDAVWGWNSSDGTLMVSGDRQEWERRSSVSSLLDFVVDPSDPEHLVAAVAENPEDAGLRRSDDGGRSWETIEGPALARLAWEDPDRLWGVGPDGTVWRSSDGGGSWVETGRVDGRPQAFVDAGDRLLVAAGDAIAQSADEGQSWTDLYRGLES